MDNKLPAFYISHGGGPCFWMDFGPISPFAGLAHFLEQLPNLIGTKPKAVLVISGHWEEDAFTIQTNSSPPMLYDYYGFPEHTYKLKYPAPGSEALVKRVRELFAARNIPLQEDPHRGFD